MMVTLNSRLNIAKRESGTNEFSTESNTEIRQGVPTSSSHGDITVTQEQWTTPSSQAHKLNVSVIGCYPIFFSLILILWEIEF